MDKEKRFTFTKKERLTGEKRIEKLFAQGQSFMSYPFRVVYLEKEPDRSSPFAVLISIPKKRIKSAVGRNKMKRLAREAYRLNKNQHIDAVSFGNRYCDVAFVYVAEKLCDYASVEKGIRKALRELTQRVEQRGGVENN